VSKPESVADVLADLRREALVPLGDYADRIEAACAREIAEKDAEIERLTRAKGSEQE